MSQPTPNKPDRAGPNDIFMGSVGLIEEIPGPVGDILGVHYYYLLLLLFYYNKDQ